MMSQPARDAKKPPVGGLIVEKRGSLRGGIRGRKEEEEVCAVFFVPIVVPFLNCLKDSRRWGRVVCLPLQGECEEGSKFARKQVAFELDKMASCYPLGYEKELDQVLFKKMNGRIDPVFGPDFSAEFGRFFSHLLVGYGRADIVTKLTNVSLLRQIS
jgi:hypothetical protein